MPLDDATSQDRVYSVFAPDGPGLPLVVASPHSGRLVPPSFMAVTRLNGLSLRKSEDCFIDEIFAAAPRLGAPLLCARFARAFLDANREAYELDPDMFLDDLPSYVNTRSSRVSAGLGTIARVVAEGEEIYQYKLLFAEALERISAYYVPYHSALTHLLDTTCARFGHCVLVDAHSTPSTALARERERRNRHVDIVLGDGFGCTCNEAVIRTATGVLRDRGYSVVHNTPYAGGFTTRHYGQPEHGVHALQIEINRDLYMDEATFRRRPFLDVLARDMAGLLSALGHLPPEALRSP
jgi:N-formylglutamate amidohydrolase